MKDGDTLSPELTRWIERFAADIPSADHPDYLEGVIDGIRLAANVPYEARGGKYPRLNMSVSDCPAQGWTTSIRQRPTARPVPHPPTWHAQ